MTTRIISTSRLMDRRSRAKKFNENDEGKKQETRFCRFPNICFDFDVHYLHFCRLLKIDRIHVQRPCRANGAYLLKSNLFHTSLAECLVHAHVHVHGGSCVVKKINRLLWVF